MHLNINLYCEGIKLLPKHRHVHRDHHKSHHKMLHTNCRSKTWNILLLENISNQEGQKVPPSSSSPRVICLLLSQEAKCPTTLLLLL